ncbi:MAG TPA: class I SAM-dependent methyltransferase [Geobacterales bacterium]|nr:class I SAM-dependent methyltransferase [Geobacterales bacterium]
MGIDFYISLSLVISLILFFYIFLSGFIFGAGYEPTPRNVVNRMIELAELKGDETVYDLGSGFGRIIIEISKRYPNIKCIGIEIDPLKVAWTRFVLRRNRLKAIVIRANLLKYDLRNADVIFTFLYPGLMEKLGKKLLSECTKKVRVVSYYHEIPFIRPVLIDHRHRIFVYDFYPHS